MLQAMILPESVGDGSVYRAGDVLMVAGPDHVWGDQESLKYLFVDWDDPDLEVTMADQGDDIVVSQPYAVFETVMQGGGKRMSARSKMTRMCADDQAVNLESIDQALLVNVGTALVKLGIGDYTKGEPDDVPVEQLTATLPGGGGVKIGGGGIRSAIPGPAPHLQADQSMSTGGSAWSAVTGFFKRIFRG